MTANRRHLIGIVSIWLTNGNKPVDGANDTRYEFFSGGYMDAANATEVLIDQGFLDADLVDDYVHDVNRVTPTAMGVAAALGHW